MITYSTIVTAVEHKSEYEFTRNAQYLTLNGEL